MRPHLITAATEHHAVLHTCRALEREGAELTVLPVDANGLVSAGDLRRALRPATALVSIMHANNETGVVQPIAELAAIAREAGVPFHTDAVQSCGKIPVNIGVLGVDLVSLSAHKFGGPKGTGALYVRPGIALRPILHGGQREGEPRPGTENVAGIVGMGAAAELAGAHLEEDGQRLGALRYRLEANLLARIGHAGRNVAAKVARVPSTSSMYFDYIDGEAMVIALDLAGVSCSTGAACSSGAVAPSHVLLAMGVPARRARSSLRFSLGRQNNDVEIAQLTNAVCDVIARLRALSPETPSSAGQGAAEATPPFDLPKKGAGRA